MPAGASNASDGLFDPLKRGVVEAAASAKPQLDRGRLGGIARPLARSRRASRPTRSRRSHQHSALPCAPPVQARSRDGVIRRVAAGVYGVLLRQMLVKRSAGRAARCPRRLLVRFTERREDGARLAMLEAPSPDRPTSSTRSRFPSRAPCLCCPRASPQTRADEGGRREDDLDPGPVEDAAQIPGRCCGGLPGGWRAPPFHDAGTVAGARRPGRSRKPDRPAPGNVS